MSVEPLICPGCADTGWFEFTDQHNTRRATTCACRIGLMRAPAGSPTFAERVADDQWRQVWPDGLPVPDDSWCTPGLLTSAYLPAEMRRWTRETYPAPSDAHVAMADAWIADRGSRSDVVLFGSHGTGKTGLAIVMLRGALARGASCRYTLASDFLRQIRQTFREHSDVNERDVMEAFAKPDVLVLDELNIKATEFAEDTINWLVETRQRALRATIITTNIGGAIDDADDAMDELRRYVGNLVFDRLRERGQFWRMNGASLRQTYGASI